MREGRDADALRPVTIRRGYTDMTPGSVLMEMGRTRVLCTVAFDEDIPPWMRESGEGWVTAEYAMLPGSSPQRVRRSSISGGRTKEIQRLIGRSLRAVVDPAAMGPLTARVDCDVLQADGGTRTAAITGAWVALADHRPRGCGVCGVGRRWGVARPRIHRGRRSRGRRQRGDDRRTETR